MHQPRGQAMHGHVQEGTQFSLVVAGVALPWLESKVTPDGPRPAKPMEVDARPRETPGAEPPSSQSLACCWSMAAGKAETQSLLLQLLQITRARVSFWAESGHAQANVNVAVRVCIHLFLCTNK